MMFQKKKRTKTSDRKKALDRIFSKFIRLRDADENGYCRCITCGRVHHWKEMDAGHFVKRDRNQVRFDERNVHAQCKYCNYRRKGEEAIYSVKIDQMYGSGTAELLVNLGQYRGKKLDPLWIETKITEYNEKVKNM